MYPFNKNKVVCKLPKNSLPQKTVPNFKKYVLHVIHASMVIVHHFLMLWFEQLPAV